MRKQENTKGFFGGTSNCEVENENSNCQIRKFTIRQLKKFRVHQLKMNQ